LRHAAELQGALFDDANDLLRTTSDKREPTENVRAAGNCLVNGRQTNKDCSKMPTSAAPGRKHEFKEDSSYRQSPSITPNSLTLPFINAHIRCRWQISCISKLSVVKRRNLSLKIGFEPRLERVAIDCDLSRYLLPT